MAQSIEHLTCVSEEVQIQEADLHKTGSVYKISSKLAEGGSAQPILSIDLSELKKRGRDVKLTKVTHDLQAINISPRSHGTLISFKTIPTDEGIEETVVTTPSTPSGKRVASTALATTSDEDSDSGGEIADTNIEHDYAHRQDTEHDVTDSGISETASVDLSDRENLDQSVSWSPVSDHDYENIGSPGSTASGPTYARQPGFNQHAHEVIARPKNKKKKTHIPLIQSETPLRTEPTPPTRSKPKRGQYCKVLWEILTPLWRGIVMSNPIHFTHCYQQRRNISLRNLDEIVPRYYMDSDVCYILI